MVFIGHLALALAFTIGLYLAATYSSLRYEINQIKQLQANINAQLAQRQKLMTQIALNNTQELNNQLTYCDGQLSYYKSHYNEAVENFNIRKKSIFSMAVLRLFKKLNQQFLMIV